MLDNPVNETNNMLAAQTRLFINVDIVAEMFLNPDGGFCASEVSYALADANAVRVAMYRRQDKFYDWCERVNTLKRMARKQLNNRLKTADQCTRPYNPNSLGHLCRTDPCRIKLRRPFAALADAVRSTIKAARMEDRAGQREGKHRLLRMTFDSSYTQLVFQVMGKHWPALHTAVDTAKYRFDTGHWKAPVWTGTLPSRHDEHFVHASCETPGNVAFYADTDKLEADKLTSMKPGRYLATFYGDVLTAEEIKRWANKQMAFAAPLELKFVGNDDPLGWVWVYENSAASCMRYNRRNRYINIVLKNDKHPVTVYAHPENNLALAYIMLPGEVEDRTRFCNTDEYIVGARTIVNKESKTYLRIYAAGDVQDTTMREALERAGYTQSNSTLRHEKLRLEEVEDGYLCPYLDGNYENVEIHNSHLLVGVDGMSARETCGYVREDEDGGRRCCDACGEHYDEDDGSYIGSVPAWVCDVCIERGFVSAIGRFGNSELYCEHDDDIVFCEANETYYVTDYLSENGMGMAEDGEVYPEDQLVETQDGVYHMRDAVELTYEFSGYGWALCDRVYTLPNGETCHVNDADKIAEIEALEQEAA